MIPFKGLLKKEFYITRLWFFTWIIIMLIAIIASYIIASRNNEPMVPVGFHIAIYVFHFGFLPLMLLSSLKLEGRNQFWLHNPQGSKTLLLAKVTIIFIYQAISQLILTVSYLFVYKYVLDHGSQIVYFSFPTISFIYFFSLLTGLYWSCWILFYWCVYHSLGKYPIIKKIRWLFLLFLLFIFNAIVFFLMKIANLADNILNWKLPVHINPDFNYDKTSHGWSMQFDLLQISIIPIIVYAFIGIALYFAASWLLDKKVEV